MKHGLIVLVSVALLGGCGFQLRGQAALPFSAAYVDAPAGSALGEFLRLSLRSEHKLAAASAAAPVRIKISQEIHNKNILSLSGNGKVSEYRLEYRVGWSAYDAKGAELVAPFQSYQTRDYTNNDNQALAKEAEESVLNREMEEEALRQALRRLSGIRLVP